MSVKNITQSKMRIVDMKKKNGKETNGTDKEKIMPLFIV